MTQPDWEPDNELERDLLAARQGSDQQAFLRRLARADLLLPLLPGEADGDEPVSWLTSQIGGDRYVVAFTSQAAMNRLMRGEPPHRVARFGELAGTWPDESVQLAVDPGVPIEAFIGPEVVVELAAAASLPVTDFEQALARAMDAENVEAYATLLLPVNVVVPVPPDGNPSRDITDPDFNWWIADDEATIFTFTSEERMRDLLGAQELVEVAFTELAKAWPNEGLALAVDPGTTYGGVLAGEAILYLADEVSRRERIADEAIRLAQSRTDLSPPEQMHLANRLAAEELGEEPPELDIRHIEPSVTPQASQPAPTGGTTVQVVILPALLDRYLRQGHRRVAGLIHQRPASPVPLGKLYEQLGLLGDGSPFGAQDAAGYVLRWQVPEPDAYSSPTMEGVDLAEGTAIYQIDSSGGERQVASLTVSGWVPA